MRKLKNVIYINTPGYYLHKDHETIAIKIEGSDKYKIPIHTVESIVLNEMCSISPQAMMFCSKNGIRVVFVSDNFRFRARVEGPISGNVLLRKRQYELYENEQISAEIARNIIASKISNQRYLLKRFANDNKNKDNIDEINSTISALSNNFQTLKYSDNIDSIRGLEGESAAQYFSCFDHLIHDKKSGFSFNTRNKRPPLDNVNTMLSFLYSLLANDCASAIESTGLDPQVGFLHRIRPGRMSLALDIMEEFRAYLVDRMVLSLINLKIVKKTGFEKQQSGAVLLKDKTKKEIIKRYQDRKREVITHPYLKEKLEIGLLPYAQALLLSRYIRGDLEMYPPFMFRRDIQ